MAKLITQTKDGEMAINMPGRKRINDEYVRVLCALNPHLRFEVDKKRNAYILSYSDGKLPRALCLSFSKTNETNTVT